MSCLTPTTAPQRKPNARLRQHRSTFSAPDLPHQNIFEREYAKQKQNKTEKRRRGDAPVPFLSPLHAQQTPSAASLAGRPLILWLSTLSPNRNRVMYQIYMWLHWHPYMHIQCHYPRSSKRILPAISDVQKPVFVLLVLINLRHKSSWRFRIQKKGSRGRYTIAKVSRHA